MQTLSLEAKERKILGRKVKGLRREGILPANIYGKGVKSKVIQVALPEFKEVYAKSGETGVVEVLLSGKKIPVLIHTVQKDPVSDEFIHTDLLAIDLTKKVHADVAIVLSGESPAEKQGLGTVVQYIKEVPVVALPKDLPEKFMVDASGLSQVDQAIYIKDLLVDKGKIELEKDPEEIIVKVEPPQKIEEPEVSKEEVAAEGVEGEAPAEGETPAEEKPQEETPKEQTKE